MIHSGNQQQISPLIRNDLNKDFGRECRGSFPPSLLSPAMHNHLLLVSPTSQPCSLWMLHGRASRPLAAPQPSPLSFPAAEGSRYFLQSLYISCRVSSFHPRQDGLRAGQRESRRTGTREDFVLISISWLIFPLAFPLSSRPLLAGQTR